MISSILLGKVAFYFVFALLVFLTLREFYTLSTADHIKPFHFYGSFIGVVIFTMFYIYCQKIVDEKIFLPLMPIILSFFLVELYRKNKHPFNNIAYTVFGIVYICLPFSALNFFVFEEKNTVNYNYHLILFYFLLVWTYDTAAYVFGLMLGSSPLFRRISPKKTWEGLIGGTIVTITLAVFLSKYYTAFSILAWMVIGLIIVIAGTFGDLAESLYKRSLNIKV